MGGNANVDRAREAILHRHRVAAAAQVADASPHVVYYSESLVGGHVKIGSQKGHRSHGPSVRRRPDAFDGLILRSGHSARTDSETPPSKHRPADLKRLSFLVIVDSDVAACSAVLRRLPTEHHGTQVLPPIDPSVLISNMSWPVLIGSVLAGSTGT
jgi:hypothetical protein